MQKPQPIRSILEKTIKSLEIDVPLKTYSILGAWNEIVGESVAAHSQPHSIRNRILFIDVTHPTWMQQLQFLKPTLLEKVNTFLGESLIEDIRFKLGKISSNISPLPQTPSMEDERVDRSTLNRIESLLQGIDDEEVRNSLREVFIKGAKLEHYRRRSK
ncbi:MAG TPA: DUF721 domain-containing protein [Thermodesulfobacteriota bacterium]|nr:DUF721 domain-containing protein [Thermodesulfobacteriota bacterium]